MSSHAVLQSQSEHAIFNSKGSIFQFCRAFFSVDNWPLSVVRELEASVCHANSLESYA